MRFDPTKILIVLALVVVIGVPFIFRPAEATPDPNALTLVIISPHNEQIRTEFDHAFDRWHRAHFNGQGVIIDWRTPGGTSEIRKQLYAEYQAAIDDGPIKPDSMSYDLLFGGGTYEHGKMKTIFEPKNPSAAENEAGPWSTTISVPVDFTPQQLSAWYGQNKVGDNTLYDPDHHWFGTALSGFGVVFNREVLRDLGVPDLKTWDDLTNPKLQGWVALADPGQSGSICTTFDAILQRAGWEDGWRILQEAAANSRYFSNSSSKVPIDISIGEAAAGMCIDFYGRYQAQSIKDAGGGDRVGYIDPPKMTDIDPDPVSLLAGAPHPDLAKRFIEFCLSESGQALWQYPATHSADSDALGPREFELRRMPIRHTMYEPIHATNFVDQVNPFEIAEPIDNRNFNIRALIPPMFSAMAIDNHAHLRAAWKAINDADPNHPNLAQMRALFYAKPTIQITNLEVGEISNVSLDNTEHLRAIKNAWKADASKQDYDRISWTTFYRSNYREIVRLAKDH